MHAQIKARTEAEVGESVRREECCVVPLPLRYHLIQLIRISILRFINLGFVTSHFSDRCPPPGPSFGAARRDPAIRDPDECQPLPDPLLGSAERVGQSTTCVVVVFGCIGRLRRQVVFGHRAFILWPKSNRKYHRCKSRHTKGFKGEGILCVCK